MSYLFRQNGHSAAALHGAAVAHARRPCMSCLFLQNRHSAQRCTAQPWLMHGGRV